MADNPGATIGARLKAARKAKHLTQPQAGMALGLTHSSLGQWERNLTVPDLQHLVAAADLYGVSLDWLIWGGDMGSGIEGRLRKIPDVLRPGLIQRLHDEIDKTEEAAKRLPAGMAGPPVRDRDPRLSGWSAAGKAKAKPKAGTQ